MSQKQPSFRDLACSGLGYCCPYALFAYGSRQTGMIAVRLGLTERTIRLHKARFRSGEYRCEGDSPQCLKNAQKGRR